MSYHGKLAGGSVLGDRMGFEETFKGKRPTPSVYSVNWVLEEILEIQYLGNI